MVLYQIMFKLEPFYTRSLLHNKFQNTAALEACWLEIPGMRPNIKRIKSIVFANLRVPGSGSMVYQMMEEADHSVPPQLYSNATVLFSDIKGFTRISSTSTPIQVVAFLNDFFNGFDAIIAEHDAYKVETIGDAYMIVSGMPRENGNAHVQHISEIGLKMCTFVANFKLAHRPDEVIMVRIGFHSGTVAAGLVGLQAPRYCLFGETVNFASRMEFHGLPNKIQISEHPFNLLRCFYGQFVMIEHGTVEIKGKGEVTTYFLEGKEQSFNLGKQSYGKKK
ncbi:hypothetical protein niasHT_027502 [Heterodera trifolii]|uniref:Guanylate cyclase domain-containing protein n=1 Tax=Heterodera trifolii TaxID=157864 RepID=A0ABD2JMU7_9BILA